MPIAKKGNVISTLGEWHRHAPPKLPIHWAENRSAMEVARAWLEGNAVRFPPEVTAALEDHPNFGSVLSWDAEPEAKLKFDSFKGETRNSDLVVVANDSFGQYVLAVEAKADEEYDKTVAATFAAALERRIENPRSKGVARIERLVSALLRPRIRGGPKAAELRYQLLTACAGAVAEAVRRKASRAVMLVHEFITPETLDTNHERNAVDLQRFLSRVTGTAHERVIDGQLYGPFAFAAFDGVQLFIGKVTRNLRFQ